MFFLSLVDPDVLVPTLNGLKVAATEWIWVSDISLWCIDGVREVLNVR